MPKIWNSHWPLATSALIPSWLMPASRQRSRCFFNDFAGNRTDVLEADAGVVRTLRSRVTLFREAERAAVLVEEVFLLEAEPCIFVVEVVARLFADAE